MRTKIKECKKCGAERPIYAKGMCGSCYQYDYNNKLIERSKNEGGRSSSKGYKSKSKRSKRISSFGKSERSKLIRELDSVFSKLRKHESLKRNGKLDCFTCHKELTMEQAQLGHFRRRKHIGCRWFKPNGNIQCNHCNVVLDGNEKVHERRIEDVYGPEILEEIFQRSRVTKVSNEDLKELLQKLTKELNNYD